MAVYSQHQQFIRIPKILGISSRWRWFSSKISMVSLVHLVDVLLMIVMTNRILLAKSLVE